MGTKTEFDNLNNYIASIEDWAQNFKVEPVPFTLSAEQLALGGHDDVTLDGLVHKGFLEELRAVQSLVVAALKNNGGKSRPVYVTGHSQGGAEAALATRALLAGGFPVAATYTFAAPRSGDKAFADSIPVTLPVHRVEFGHDIVPHVPPKLVSEALRGIIAGLLHIPSIPKKVESLLNSLQNSTVQMSFTGVGRLCYGNHETKALRVDISAEQEEALFATRLMGLVYNPEFWAEHHHLAGTTEEVRQRIKGNYTALVSEFPIV